MGSQKPGKVRPESVPPRQTRPQTKTSSFYACFTTQVIIQRQDISLFLGSSSVFCANASFQTASEQHPLSGGRTERENVEAEAEAAFWLFRLRRSSSLPRSVLFRRSVCLSVLPPEQRSLNSTAGAVAYSPSRGTTAVPSLPCDGSGSFSSSHHVRSSPSVRLRSALRRQLCRLRLCRNQDRPALLASLHSSFTAFSMPRI